MKEQRVRGSAHQQRGAPPARILSSLRLSLSLSLAFITVCAARSRTRVRRPGVIARSGVNDVNRDVVVSTPNILIT